jgi:hypothetical protein
MLGESVVSLLVDMVGSDSLRFAPSVGCYDDLRHVSVEVMVVPFDVSAGRAPHAQAQEKVVRKDLDA